jgi:DNA-binding NtrC family response regulator
LVIDGEATVREFSSGALTRAGMRVLVADTVKAGVETFREHSGIISVVLLDPPMPVEGAKEALSLLKETNPAVPVIVSSGFDEAEAARRFPEPKPARFLQKPYTMERLLEAVAAVLQRA